MTELKYPELTDGLINSLVYETFGLRRFTQDSPIKPDVWIRLLKLARLKDADRQRRVPLILTPYQKNAEDGTPPGHTGQLSNLIRDKLVSGATASDPGDTKSKATPAKQRVEILTPLRLAATNRYIAVDVTFDDLTKALVPITRWWNVQRQHFGKPLKEEIEKKFEQHQSVRQILVSLENTELVRFAALVAITNLLWKPEQHDDVIGLAKRLAPNYRLTGNDYEYDGDEYLLVQSRRKANEIDREDFSELWKAYESAIGVKELERVSKANERQKGGGNIPDVDGNTSIFSMQINRRAYRLSGTQIYHKQQTPGAQSAHIVKADAARRLFNISTKHLVWGVIDTGIDATHLAFADPPHRPHSLPNKTGKALPNQQSRIISTVDFTKLRELQSVDYDLDAHIKALYPKGDPDFIADKKKAFKKAIAALKVANQGGNHINWELIERLIKYDNALQAPEPEDQHGTHVAGILAGDLEEGMGNASDDSDQKFVGVCPDIRIYDLRVFSSRTSVAGVPDKGLRPPDEPGGDEFTILAALDYVAWLNRDPMFPVIHGVNLSLAIPFVVNTFACGHTPICDACDRLVWNGTVVVAAAGNFGFDEDSRQASLGVGYRGISITDPGNANEVITVGATHYSEPNTYGVSFFSGRGPTGDGRMKPDLVAPGEKIMSTAPGNNMLVLDGTSMAAPHVSGVCALLMGRFSEFVGEPERIKKVLMNTATDLGRERHFQGAGLVDALRALQSI